MSKLDAQRAMREANYARRQAAAPAARPRVEAPVAPPATKATRTPRKKAAPAAAEGGTAAGTCGHTSMNGRSCTRPAGHSEKSHRYS